MALLWRIVSFLRALFDCFQKVARFWLTVRHPLSLLRLDRLSYSTVLYGDGMKIVADVLAHTGIASDAVAEITEARAA